MRKFLNIALRLEKIVVDGQPLVQIAVPPVSIRDWCLSLQLLQENLVEAIIFRVDKPQQRVEVTVGVATRCDIGQDGTVYIILNTRNLDFVRHFYLRYYRDGVAEVDHIDIETDEGVYITFKVEESLPPVSLDEAKRRLGMD